MNTELFIWVVCASLQGAIFDKRVVWVIVCRTAACSKGDRTEQNYSVTDALKDQICFNVQLKVLVIAYLSSEYK